MKFLLEKDLKPGQFDLKKMRKDAQKASKQAQKDKKRKEEQQKRNQQKIAQQTKKTARTNIHKGEYTDFLTAKKDFETESGKNYAKLNNNERSTFINNIINKMKNSKALNNARYGIINAIKNSNWDADLIYYLNKAQNENIKLTDNVVNLMADLIADRKINIKTPFWYLKSLYDRDEDDMLYTIKALTLASNKELQNEDGSNKFFDDNNPLKISDLIDGTEIKGADEIVDIINSKQTKDYKFKASHTRNAKDTLKQKTGKSDIEVDKAVAQAKEKITQEVSDVLASLGLNKKAIKAAVSEYIDSADTAEEIIENVLKGINDSKF